MRERKNGCFMIVFGTLVNEVHGCALIMNKISYVTTLYIIICAFNFYTRDLYLLNTSHGWVLEGTICQLCNIANHGEKSHFTAGWKN